MIIDRYDFTKYNSTLEYTEKYIHKVVQNRYNIESQHQIFKAMDVAKDAHAHQRMANNFPYVIHPMRVALMLMKFDRSVTSKTIIAALLHDTLADTCLDCAEIVQQFGSYVAQLIQSVTISSDTSEDFRVKREKWQEIMLNSHEVRAIKTFEDLDNIMSWKTIPVGNPLRYEIPRWLAEASELSLLLAHATNMHAYKLMQEEYAYYAKQAYAHQPVTV
jgi:(p)ppGpp synthase/HD superfamily hydrolase